MSAEKWILSEGEFLQIPSWQAHEGSRRLERAAEILGELRAHDLAREKDYCLEDSLLRSLRLKGISVKNSFAELSPREWLKFYSEKDRSLPIHEQKRVHEGDGGKELVGIILSREEKQKVMAVLAHSKRTLESPWDLLEIVDHVLFSKTKFFKLVFKTRCRV